VPDEETPEEEKAKIKQERLEKAENIKNALSAGTFKPKLVTDFDMDKQLKIMQVYDMLNIEEFLETLNDAEAGKCVNVSRRTLISRVIYMSNSMSA